MNAIANSAFAQKTRSFLPHLFIVLLTVSFIFSKAASDVLASVLAVGYLVYFIRERNITDGEKLWLLAALTFCIVLLVSSLLAERPADDSLKSLLWIRFPLFALGIKYLVLTQRKTRFFALKMMVLFVVLLSVDLIYQKIFGVDMIGNPQHSEFRLNGPYDAPRVGVFLIYFLFAAFAYVVYLSRRLSDNTLKSQCVGYALIILFAFFAFSGIFLSGDRTPFVLLFLGVGIMMLLQRKVPLLTIAFALSVGLALMIAFGIEIGLLLARQFLSTIDVITDFTNSSYGRIWQDSYMLATEKPLIGHGAGSYITTCLAHVGPLKEECHLHPHNIFLEPFFEAGLIGLLAFTIMIGLLLKDTMPAMLQKNTNIILQCLCITILLRLFPFAPTPSFFSSMSAVPFWYIVGVLLAFKEEPHEL